MNIVSNYRTFFFLAIVVIAGCSKKTDTVAIADGIVASSIASSNPILKGLSDNPLQRIVVYIPTGSTQKSYKKIHVNINSDAVKSIQKIDVYLTSSDQYATTNLIGSVNVSDSSIDIPVTLNIFSGPNYVWLSTVLKDNAFINRKIEIHSTKLIDANNVELAIKEYASPFSKLSGIAVRKVGDDAVNTYRIPGIVMTDKGTLIAVYDIRYTSNADLPSYINIGMSRSLDTGKTWQAMKIIMDMGAPEDQNGIGDPSILIDPVTKKIWVAALWSKGNHSITGSGPGLTPDVTGQFMLVNSSDDGLTWTTPASITPQVKNPAWKIMFQGPGRGIAMQDGKLVFPAQYWDASAISYSSLVYSADHGNTWTRAVNGAKSNTTECQVVETAPGKLMLNMRDNRGSFRSISTTTDLGTTWIEHTTSYSSLADPICQGSLIKANVKVNGVMKDVLVFSNPNSASTRNNITIKASLDLGESWQTINQLLIDERTGYGYSCLTKIDDNTIGLLYEGTREIYFVSIPVSDIIK